MCSISFSLLAVKVKMYNLSPFSFSYRAQNEKRKIFSKNPIHLSAKETILITGPSGGGKSTFLQLLKGIIPQFVAGKLEGQLLFKGQPLHGSPFDENLKSIIYLFQNPFTQLIYPYADEEFFFSMENFNFSKEEMEKQKQEFETSFALEKIWGRKTQELSNGECQRLVLASLLAVKPEVILLDEPTAFLDPEGRREFYHYLPQIKKDRLLIMIDHHVNEVLPFVDRVFYVDSSGEISERSKNDLSDKIEKRIIEPDFVQSSADVALTVENVQFGYDKKNPLLKDVNAHFKGHEIIVIRGKNGVGKSTLFKLFAGILRPQKGKILLSLNGVNFTGKKLQDHCGFIFQNPETHFFFDTIAEELAHGLKKNITAEEKDKLLRTFFHQLDMNKSPFMLSEGEKRRLSILLTLFMGKSLFLYDEPTFGQDSQSKEMIKTLMKTIKKQGPLQIIISHDEEFIQDVADKIYSLEEGVLIESKI